MKIKLTGIYVGDPIKAHSFYTEVLECRSLMLNEEF